MVGYDYTILRAKEALDAGTYKSDRLTESLQVDPCQIDRPNSVVGLKGLVSAYHFLAVPPQPPSTEEPTCPNCREHSGESHIVQNQHDNPAEVITLHQSKHSAEELCIKAKEYLCKCWCRSPPARIAAKSEFKTLLSDPSETSILRRLGTADARGVTEGEFICLIDLLANMFFPSNICWVFEFLPEDNYKMLGNCSTRGMQARIRLNPTLNFKLRKPSPDEGVLNATASARIGVLLHEVCHAYAEIYICRKCPAFEVNVRNFNGHGSAWQRIAFEVEKSACLELGLHLNLGRFDCIKYEWKGMKQWPTVDEVESWELQD